MPLGTKRLAAAAVVVVVVAHGRRHAGCTLDEALRILLTMLRAAACWLQVAAWPGTARAMLIMVDGEVVWQHRGGSENPGRQVEWEPCVQKQVLICVPTILDGRRVPGSAKPLRPRELACSVRGSHGKPNRRVGFHQHPPRGEPQGAR